MSSKGTVIIQLPVFTAEDVQQLVDYFNRGGEQPAALLWVSDESLEELREWEAEDVPSQEGT